MSSPEYGKISNVSDIYTDTLNIFNLLSDHYNIHIKTWGCLQGFHSSTEPWVCGILDAIPRNGTKVKSEVHKL